MMSDGAASANHAPPNGILDRTFRLTERSTSAGREIIAGATTFAAMAYIIAVNPSIMSTTGMDRGDLVIATALAALFGSALMGLWANLPLAVAPAMGSNVIFAFVIVKQMGAPWQGALAMVAFTGVVFLALSLSKVREKVAKEVPEALKVGIQAAVGALIVFIGLRGAGFVVANPSTYIAMGSLKNPATLLTMAGILLTPVLVVRKIPGALVIAIAVLTLIGLVTPGAAGKMVTTAPATLLAWPKWPAGTFGHVDFVWLFTHFLIALPLLFYFVCAEFFSTLGTLIGVTGAANLRQPDGSIPSATAAFATDAISSIVGPVLGTSVVTAYIESIAGVQAHRAHRADGGGPVRALAVLLADFRDRAAAGDRAGAGAGRRPDDAGPRTHRSDRARQRRADRTDAAADRADQQPHQWYGDGNAELDPDLARHRESTRNFGDRLGVRGRVSRLFLCHNDADVTLIGDSRLGAPMGNLQPRVGRIQRSGAWEACGGSQFGA
jgi:AGZA family xanthine/uracil permease-like MFS transporter